MRPEDDPGDRQPEEPRAPEPQYEPPRRSEESLFGEPEIPMPPQRRPGDRQRARDARTNLDLDLGRIKRRKRFGLVITTISVLFIAFVLLPVTWAGVYLFIDPPSTMLMMQRSTLMMLCETFKLRSLPL